MTFDSRSYICMLLLAGFFFIELACLRDGIYEYLRHTRHSKSYITKKQRGFWNFWLYRQLHREASIGKVYYLNAVYVFTLTVFAPLALTLGGFEMMKHPLSCFATALALLGIWCMYFYSVYHNLSVYGRRFILCKRAPGNSYLESSLFDLLCSLVPFLLLYLLHT